MSTVKHASVLKERARAKVNLTLHVLGRRTDGYHDLESLAVFADVADGLSLSPGLSESLDVTGPRAEACGALGDNLVTKAARLLREQIPALTSGQFTLDKHLPAAAGIGGGSADAAAALRLLAKANGLAYNDARLQAAGRATGADVPVCLVSSACIMRGAGESVTPLAVRPLPCVLVNPGVPVATKDVFTAIGLKAGESYTPPGGGSNTIAWPSGDAPFDAWIAAIAAGRNDLEPVAVRLQPVIGDVIALLASQGGCLLARMSGSGATCFGLFADAASAAAGAAAIRKANPDWWVEASTLS